LKYKCKSPKWQRTTQKPTTYVFVFFQRVGQRFATKINIKIILLVHHLHNTKIVVINQYPQGFPTKHEGFPTNLWTTQPMNHVAHNKAFVDDDWFEDHNGRTHNYRFTPKVSISWQPRTTNLSCYVSLHAHTP